MIIAPEVKSLRDHLRDDWRTMVFATMVFATLSVAMATLSQGFLEADGCSHFMDARFALQDKSLLTNVWGRPVCTALYMFPASLPNPRSALLAVRFTSLGVAVLLAWITYLIAIGSEFRRPVLGFLFVLAQPLVFLHSFSELTELPFATLLALTFYLYQRRSFLWMAIVAGWLPLSRPEGFGFIVLAATALIVYRRWWWLVVLPIPVILWSYCGKVMNNSAGPWWMWLPNNWPYAAQSLYDKGPLLLWQKRTNGTIACSFFLQMPVVVSPLLLPFLGIGVWRHLKRSEWRINHRAACTVLAAVIPIGILFGHSYLWWRGLMGSNGELRYMLTVSPFWALLAARGWEWIFLRFQWKHVVRFAALAAVLPILANRVYTVLPLQSGQDWVYAEQFSQWYQREKLRDRYPKLAAGHPGICLALDIEPGDARYLLDWTRDKLLNPPPGVLLVYDPIYGKYNSDARRSVTLDELLASGWKPLPGAPVFQGWSILRSPSP